ncbi:hypothetical protein [Bradyrhizobium sp. 30]|uniref:hypothetical protein n=1 Tax=Bradyrhizobium sp. 30 TaxID=2782669 RepID=UPI001FF76601|nr:hypothetical protein [Bradyrhizobium sp. 30]MCK1291967.1 hypothetical protein [Bradyrhizobium sp. 30]
MPYKTQSSAPNKPNKSGNPNNSQKKKVLPILTLRNSRNYAPANNEEAMHAPDAQICNGGLDCSVRRVDPRVNAYEMENDHHVGG